MAFPFFYKEDLNINSPDADLDEDTSKHVVQVLRMQPGEQLQLTDGKGNLATAKIIDANKKKCTVSFTATSFQPPAPQTNTIAISLVKNAHRFEWFLEKATEIGISEIIPLICSRTEKQHFRHDRMKGIIVSAMLQSQQSCLPVLHTPVKFNDFIKMPFTQQKFIAHCEEEEKHHLHQQPGVAEGKLVCIGPEGDFTIDEIYTATSSGFIPVALGITRLRTETAGVVTATLLMMK